MESLRGNVFMERPSRKSRHQERIKEMNNLHVFKKMKSPIGNLTLIAQQANSGSWELQAIFWDKEQRKNLLSRYGQLKQDANNAFLTKIQTQLEEYFRGERKTFPLQIHFKGTDFQNKIIGSITWINLLHQA